MELKEAELDEGENKQTDRQTNKNPIAITKVGHGCVKTGGDAHPPEFEVGRYCPHCSQSHPGLKGLGEELMVIH